MSSLLINTCSREAELAFENIVYRSTLGGGEALSVLLEQATDNYKKIKSIYLVSGPGSYTGLRVGSAFCMGLSKGLSVDVVSISTFYMHALSSSSFEGHLGIVIPASATDVYYAEFYRGQEVWLPNIDNQLLESLKLDDFIEHRRSSFQNYQYKTVDEFFSLPDDPSSLMKNLERSLQLQNISWKSCIQINNIADLIYMKPVAAKSLAERKKA